MARKVNIHVKQDGNDVIVYPQTIGELVEVVTGDGSMPITEYLSNIENEIDETAEQIQDVSDKADNISTSLTEALNSEIGRAQGAERGLNNAISNEVERALDAEGDIIAAISTEQSARIAAISLEAQERIKGIADEAATRIAAIQAAISLEASNRDNAIAAAYNLAETDINAETARATAKENLLDANKPDRAELISVVTDVTNLADDTGVAVTFVTYNALSKTASQFVRYFPIADNEQAGIILPAQFASWNQAVTDIATLKSVGGLWVGVNFATKADMSAWAVPSTANANDWTDVLQDETHGGQMSRYGLVSEGGNLVFEYKYTVSTGSSIGLATSNAAGAVQGDDGTHSGKIFVETDGTMSLIGWDNLNSRITTVENALPNKVDNVAGKGLSTNDYTTAEQTKLAGIAAGAQVNPDLSGYQLKSEKNQPNGYAGLDASGVLAQPFDYSKGINLPNIPAAQVNSDWNASSGAAQILNKPTIPAAYTHPAGNAPSKAAGLYKVSTDATSHVSAVAAVTKADITALGIPAQDTVYTLPSVSQSNTTSTAAPGGGGTFTAIDSVTRDSYGRVTGVNTKTITLPT